MKQLPHLVSYISIILMFFSCSSNEKYKQDLSSDNIDKIDMACFKLGELKDTSAVKLLLTKALDPRMSTHIRFKGMSVNYCKLIALRKISAVSPEKKINQFWPDTAATLFYLDWAIKQGFIKDIKEVNIYYK